MPFWGEPMTPEEAAAEQERQIMQRESIRHDMERLLDELDKDQLQTIRIMLTFGGGNAEYAAYWCGAIGATLKARFGICGCGKEHNADLLAQPGGDMVESSPTSPVNEAALQEYGVRLPTQEDYAKGLVHTPDEHPVLCSACGMLYQSLDDRMLRAPGQAGCEGCIQKAKWG